LAQESGARLQQKALSVSPAFVGVQLELVPGLLGMVGRHVLSVLDGTIRSETVNYLDPPNQDITQAT